MTLDDKLLNKLRKHSVEVGDCWEWQGAMQSSGVTPQMHLGKRVLPVRRIMAMSMGLDIEGKIVTHKCGNYRCVCPDHITVVTRQRLQKATAKRTMYGADPLRAKKLSDLMRDGRAKLTMEVAQQIREAEGRQRDIAARFGVSQSTVSEIKRGATWKTYSGPWVGLMGAWK